MLEIACTSEQKVPVTAAPTTAAGNVAQLDGALVVSVLSGDGTFEQDGASPLSFNAVSGPGPGTTVYRIEGDADLGSGVVTIQDTVELTVNNPNASNFGLSAGTAIPK